MEDELTFGQTLTGVIVLFGAIGIFCVALLAVFSGHAWQASLFGAGGLYLSLWSGFRLSRAG